MINLGIIGATGSVGSSVMSVCEAWPDKICVKALAANSRSEKLSALAQKFHVDRVYAYETDGEEGLERLAVDDEINHVVFASSGTKAIKALCSALKAGKNVSLANKESIVVAGQWVMPLVKRPDQLRPLDSEHNAIWQCLHGEDKNFVSKIYLTASGGPFRKFSSEELKRVTPEMALKHPVWNMGAKITIDSATLMNKGIELIEAMILFGLDHEKVDALISPGSFVHGLVEFDDGSVKMLAAEPDMKLPAASCLFWPERFFPSPEFVRPRYDFHDVMFETIDTERFPSVRIAREVMRKKGAYPAVLIGADEAAVDLFLKGRISFTNIPALIEETLSVRNWPEPRSLDEAIELVDEGRREALRLSEKFAKNILLSQKHENGKILLS
ncbi:MAG: 1-deoxy-D-xylulose-5-phosphate reductoisomerase [Synergistaceae bacterium]|nr:1-deoxy-D-xylulose-5-phosphate reductoisomerase [Synergistaceae bacterium]